MKSLVAVQCQNTESPGICSSGIVFYHMFSFQISQISLMMRSASPKLTASSALNQVSSAVFS